MITVSFEDAVSFGLEQSLMQHCRLLFESLCRSVKPFLLFLLRSLGTVPSLENKTAALSPCRTQCQPRQLPSGQGGGCSSTRVWNRHQAVRPARAVQVLPLRSSLPDELLAVKPVWNHRLHHYLQGISFSHGAVSVKYFMYQSTDSFQSRILWFHTDVYPLPFCHWRSGRQDEHRGSS